MNLVKHFITENDCWKYNQQRLDERYCRFQDEGPKGIAHQTLNTAVPSLSTSVLTVSGSEVEQGGVYIKKQATFTSSLQNANHKSNLISTNLT